MGTEYVHSISPPTEITITKGSTTTIDIPHVTSALTIGNTLQINMRQRFETDLNFVSFKNRISLTEVIIDSNDVTDGDYELILESYDESNSV